MNPLDIHDEWLSLIEVSGPFLATPVLKRIFSTGLPAVEPRIRQYLRQAYDEWCEARDNDDPRFTELHRAWIHEVLARGLEYDETDSGELLLRGERIPPEQCVTLPEHGVTLEPDYALVSGGKSQLLVQIYSAGTDLQVALKSDGWTASPAERMERLCRASGCRLGLVTDGERWMLVDAPVGAVSTFASWYARLWGQERLTLQAFLTLLGIRRFFGPDDETLPSMLDESLQHQEEVTDALGEQVRRAVEVLIQALGKEDRERSGALLQGVEPAELYEAGLTIMMRLVFLLSAEERGLLLIGEEAYESNYAISTLRMQLRQETEEVLERRHDAWSRLLATFRAVFGGIEHEALRLPALGGSLFDPDRFPFLEGRTKGSDWKVDSARPLPIDNRTVLLLLEAIQQYGGRTLSYRALDVEQIGYVYEGLLERTVARTERVTVELSGGKGAKKTLYTLEELEALHQGGGEALAEALSGADAIKRGGGAIRKDLERSVDAAQANRLLTACAGDEGLRDRALPFLNLLRTDPWGYPLIYPEGAFIVITGSDRRETGTHYTPKLLTEAIVAETLTPVAYVGPAEGMPRDQWVIKSPAELLDLKICDPAMGSGAFLVQACRWLSDCLVEAWSRVEASGKTISVDGEVLDAVSHKEPLPRDAEARTIIARRIIAERCLYGVDLNPLAVELAKLSIWLVTLAKGRPFSFLDHNLRCGDSLLGICRLDQLTQLSMNPIGQGQLRLFGQNIERAVRDAIELRQQLREMPIRDIRDVEAMAHLDIDARRRLEVPECIADAFIGEVFASNGGMALENTLASLTIQAGQAVDGDRDVLDLMRRQSVAKLSTGQPAEKLPRRPFHWPLEFPEVFSSDKPGFSALIGNPPFMGGSKIATAFGNSYRDYLIDNVANGRRGQRGQADLCSYFVCRMALLVRVSGAFGMIATNTISQGDTRVVGLDQLVEGDCKIYWAISSQEWPGKASVMVALLCVRAGAWQNQSLLNGAVVKGITAYLTVEEEVTGNPCRLAANKNRSFEGSRIEGQGFVLSPEAATELIISDCNNSHVLKPYLRGDDFLSRPDQSPAFWVIDFKTWPLSRATAPAGYQGPVAEDYRACLDIVEREVKPQRLALPQTIQINISAATNWWRYRDTCPALQAALKESAFSRVLFHAFTSKHVAFSFVDSSYVFAAPHNVFIFDDWGSFSVLQSTLHVEWAYKYCSTLGATLRYTRSSIFETFPFPSETRMLADVGERYYEARAELMRDAGYGLRALYNSFHDKTNDDPKIEELRRLHAEMDKKVVESYGWGDLKLHHGHFETSHGVRFTLEESIRRELLIRLLQLNRLRFEEEVTQGLHGEKGRSSSRSSRVAHTASAAAVQPSFDFEAGPTNNNVDPVTAILGLLSTRVGWFAKADILAATGITDGQWNATIADLIAGSKVERQGERRGARYRFIGRLTDEEEIEP